MDDSKLNLKGRFETLEDLYRERPAATEGDICIVRNRRDGSDYIYRWSDFLKAWVNRGWTEQSTEARYSQTYDGTARFLEGRWSEEAAQFNSTIKAKFNLSQLLNGAAGRNCGFLCAYRPGLSKNENEARQKELYADLFEMYYAHIPLEGYWEEKIENVAEGEETIKRHEEESCAVTSRAEPEAFTRMMVSLGRKYNQDAVIIKRMDAPDVRIYDGYSVAYENKGPLGVKTLEECYSALRGHRFEFRESDLRCVPGKVVNSAFSAMAVSPTRAELVNKYFLEPGK